MLASYHIVGEWLSGVEQVAPYLGASGFEYVMTLIYKPCGFVVRAESESAAWSLFWDEYHQMSPDTRPWRNLRMSGRGV